MNEYTITNWNDFNDLLFRDAWNETIHRYRSNYVFRGLAAKDRGLVPGLNRVCLSNLELERSLLRNFKKYASLEIKEPDNFWEMVSLAQHHGLPTRLLDWTFSPYVAAHFATEDFDSYHTDGIIYCFNFVESLKYLPERLRNVLKDNAANTFSVDMLKDVAPNYETLKAMEQDEPYFLFFEPSSIDDRITNQYALFSVASDAGAILSEWLPRHPDLWYRIVIPAAVKLEIRDKLDQINITERIIYPGLDGLCRWLARQYTPRKYFQQNEKKSSEDDF